jgi:protein phosphatase PTC7
MKFRLSSNCWKIKTTLLGFAILNIFGWSTLATISNSDNSNALAIHGYFKSASTMIPHPEKAYKGGEDALIVKDRMISVADGVGGWAHHGVDVAKYSKQLMRLIGEVYDKNPNATPKQIMTEANSETTEKGTSTWVIAILNPQNRTIATTLVGDSGYLIVRPDHDLQLETIYRSVEQQKRFNFPYQIGTGGDSPSVGIDKIHSVKHNDILIMGSDGVFDNCFDMELWDIVKLHLENNGNLRDIQMVSDKIGKLAEKHGVDEKWRSPFQIHSEKSYGREVFRGGKQDDIAVIVSQIKFEE